MKLLSLGAVGLLMLSSVACSGEMGEGDPDGAVAENVGQAQEAVIDPTYAIGVIPINAGDCPPVNTVTLYTDDEDDNNESDSTGWDAPSTARRARQHNTGRAGTTFTFCRVDGRNFKALTRYGNTNYYYSVLKLGTTCPNGSKDVQRNVDGEHDDNRNALTGPAGPNRLLGSTAELHFCLFDSIQDKMYSFPDIGMFYAVFHDYDSGQPAFVLGKKWVYTDNEDLHPFQGTFPSSGAVFDAFSPMIGGDTNTMFDMARVW